MKCICHVRLVIPVLPETWLVKLGFVEQHAERKESEIEISLLSFSVARDWRRQKWTPTRSWETIFGETKRTRTRRKKIVFPCSTYSPRSGDGEADGPLLLPRLTVERCDRWLDWVRRRSFLLPSWKECFFLLSRNVGGFQNL